MIVVTAASGRLGRLVLEKLLDRGVTASELRAVARTTDKLADFAALGVEVVAADYSRPETLGPAFRGADRLLFVSSLGTTEDRIIQHRNVVAAAVQARVGQLVYTSIVNADTNPTLLALAHRDTEAAIAESGLPSVLLRNNWYFENTTDALGESLERGEFVGAAGGGGIGYAARADYAEAAAVVLTTEGHTGRAYDLTGDQAVTQAEVAAEVARRTGRPFAYRSLPEAEYRELLGGFGLPPFLTELLADADARTAEGALAVTTGDLARLLGRPTTSLAAAVDEALSRQPA
ncbi:MAG: NAD(P)H-binding protein [Mycobacteriaceae bacterium]|nr:NAD(P)H-binding protein [Mycobacteriaceae bacterium]